MHSFRYVVAIPITIPIFISVLSFQYCALLLIPLFSPPPLFLILNIYSCSCNFSVVHRALILSNLIRYTHKKIFICRYLSLKTAKSTMRDSKIIDTARTPVRFVESVAKSRESRRVSTGTFAIFSRPRVQTPRGSASRSSKCPSLWDDRSSVIGDHKSRGTQRQSSSFGFRHAETRRMSNVSWSLSSSLDNGASSKALSMIDKPNRYTLVPLSLPLLFPLPRSFCLYLFLSLNER